MHSVCCLLFTRSVGRVCYHVGSRGFRLGKSTVSPSIVGHAGNGVEGMKASLITLRRGYASCLLDGRWVVVRMVGAYDVVLLLAL